MWAYMSQDNSPVCRIRVKKNFRGEGQYLLFVVAIHEPSQKSRAGTSNTQPARGSNAARNQFFKIQKRWKITFFSFFSEKNTIFQLLFIIFLVFLAQQLIMVININLLLFWCGPRSPKNVFMRAAKPRMSLMRPVSQFEFETPGLG